MKVPFNRPHVVGKEFDYICEAIERGQLSGNGIFTRQCQSWIEREVGAKKSLLTHSCTAALEMAAILANVQPGDEVILPSFTFVSTANAFVLRGAVPVFVDIRRDTLNLDERLILNAVTPRTRVIAPVHYAGVGCDMRTIMDIARRHNLMVIEDAAQGLMSSYREKPLGSIGHLSAFSFHETKNVISGEGGALAINDVALVERAEIIWEKGTNRSRFFRGEVDRYTWVDVGSSFLPSEVIAAFLWAQLEHARLITERRLSIWRHYHEAFAPLEADGIVRRPVVPSECAHNAHMYYLLMPDLDTRTRFLAAMREHGIVSVFHYVPLHSSPAGQRFGRAHGKLAVTDTVSDCLVRLPMYADMSLGLQEKVIEVAQRILGRRGQARLAC